ncbi:hypothetical protein AA309_31490 [Microvirga vignae]|uniref:Uncharacterized protein n=1 Tax=Microvirga vignae TaxID=1225564 RepID=A0A0H1R2U4_9HYPH|nr:hypothetical protein [Microvirga vignae]KLK89433.1 hypothetical protein AA309_31490 [Microvirga vignae]
MNRTTLNRLAKLEASVSHRDGVVHVISAHTDEEFEEKRTAFIEEHGANPHNIFVQVHKFTHAEPFTTGKTMPDLLAGVAMYGRRVHDYGRNAQ